MKATFKFDTDVMRTEAERLQGRPAFMMIKWRRFHNRQAWTGGIEDYVLIKSYNTIVGIVDVKNGYTYELGHWSQTTTQQIRAIWNECFSYTTEFVPYIAKKGE